MPRIHYGPHTFEARTGERLRDAMLRNGDSPHAPRARIVNCKGFGTCGTCAVRIEGAVEPPTPSLRERARFHVPPHAPDTPLRLACQVRVGTEDLTVRKHPGFWGQHTDEPPVVG